MKKKYTGIFRDGGAGNKAQTRYRNRRKKLMDRVGELMVLTGVPYGPGKETLWSYSAHAETYQEPSMMYLTGINQENVLLLLDPKSKESKEILFVPEKNPVKEFWDGTRFGVGDPRSLAEVRKVTGIKDVRDLDDFETVLEQRFRKQKSKRLGAFWLEGKRGNKKVTVKGDHNWKFKTRVNRLLRRWGASANAIFNIQKDHFDLRLPLDAYDEANAQKAVKLTSDAFKSTLKRFHHFKNECQIRGYLESQMLMRSPYGLSYPSIVASGQNATVLHYLKNDDDFGSDEMVLIDFGVRWMTMHADITRTFPSSGKFNPLQKVLYQIVLDAQVAVEKLARAGVTIQQLNDCCWDSINRDLETKFKPMGGTFELPYQRNPHGVSHLMGEQEHDGDPFRGYASQPMQAGWMISNEPGLYGRFRLKHRGKVYDQEIGIRIEDNLVIKEKGCLNLARMIPKTIADIERWMAAGKKEKVPNPLAND